MWPSSVEGRKESRRTLRGGRGRRIVPFVVLALGQTNFPKILPKLLPGSETKPIR